MIKGENTMAMLAPVAGLLPSLSGAIGTITAIDQTLQAVDKLSGNSKRRAKKAYRRQQNTALAQLQQDQEVRLLKEQSNANITRSKIQVDANKAARKRRLALKRAVSRQRAKFGASGIGSSKGSAEAVLLGLFDETQSQKKERDRLDNIRLSAIDNNLDSLQRKNLLEVSQLAERQSLKRIAAGF